ncbi:MAG: EamA family transporter, partial [bacterium]|nr:EamA family transporter [bacterium]
LLGGFLAMVGYGVSDFLAKKAIDKIGNLKVLFYTQLIGAVFMLLYFIGDRTIPVFDLKNIISVVTFGFFNAAGYLALYKSFEMGKLSIVSPISSSSAILAAVISFLFFGETFSTLKILSLLLVLSGIVLAAIDPKGLKNGFGKKDLSKGVPEALMVFLIFGIYVPFWDKFLNNPGWIVWVILVRLVLAFFLIFYQKSILKKELSLKLNKIIYLLIVVAIFEAAGSFGSSWGLHASVNTTSIVAAVTSTYPLITAILAFIFLKERLMASQYVGIGFIITGLLISPFV